MVEEFAVDTGPEWRAVEPHAAEKKRRTAPLKVANVTEISARPEHGPRWLKLARFNRGTLHGWERALASLLAEVKRIAACVGLPRHAVEEAETLARMYADAISGRTEAVALLWLAARRMGVLKPPREFLKCGRVERAEFAREAFRLAELVKPSAERPRLEDYVKVVAARMNLPAKAARRALRILRRNKKVIIGRNPWVCAAAALYLAANRQISAWHFAAAAGVTDHSVVHLARKLRV